MFEPRKKSSLHPNDRIALIALGGLIVSASIWTTGAWLASWLASDQTFSQQLLDPPMTDRLIRLSMIVIVLCGTLLAQILYARRLQLDRLLEIQKELTARMFEVSPAAVVNVGADHRVAYANPTALALWAPGVAVESGGVCCWEGSLDKEACADCLIDEALRMGEMRERVIHSVLDVGERWTEQIIYPILDETDKATSVVIAMRDVTERSLDERELERRAMFDELTGLPNRALYLDRLNATIRRGERMGEQIAVAFLDLNGFKAINDEHGHRVGDVVIRATAQRLARVLRSEDTIARWGGDEFTVLGRVAKREDIKPLVMRIFSAFEEPVEFEGLSLRVGAAVGIAVYPWDGLDAAALVERADAAMYRAKGSGERAWYAFETAEPAGVKDSPGVAEDATGDLGAASVANAEHASAEAAPPTPHG